MGSPSQTAKKIARFLLLIDAIPRLRGLLPADAAAEVEAILRASGAVRAYELDMMRAAWTQRVYQRAERWFGGRGQLVWFGLRKRFIADAVTAALAGGATQLLVVGAGFDPLAVAMARRYPDLLCVEIDTPDTAAPKRRGIDGSALSGPDHRVVSVDLSEISLADALRDTPWRADAPSVVVAEGLLMCLRSSEVEAFFTGLANVTGRDSQVIFTAVNVDERGRPHLGTLDRTIRLVLRLIGEAMHWGIAPAHVPGFLRPLGWRVVDQPDQDQLRTSILDPLGLHDEPVVAIEHITVAARIDR